MFAAIDADIESQPVETAIELFIGDYVDRGPDSAGVIARALEPRAGRERICLMGNHEDAMVAALSDGTQMDRWLSFGGDATLRSYGIDPADHTNNPQAMQPLLQSVLPPEHLAFLSRLETSHRIGDTLFVHAGIRPGVPLDEQDRNDLIWIREEFLEDPGPFPVHVVHGHTPVDQPEALAWRTNVDTGAVYGGSLTAAVLEGDSVRFLSIQPEESGPGR